MSGRLQQSNRMESSQIRIACSDKQKTKTGNLLTAYTVLMEHIAVGVLLALRTLITRSERVCPMPKQK